MPRKKSGTFDQMKYMQQWQKENMASISLRYKKDFVYEFRNACQHLNISQSEVFRQTMNEVIQQYKQKMGNE